MKGISLNYIGVSSSQLNLQPIIQDSKSETETKDQIKSKVQSPKKKQQELFSTRGNEEEKQADEITNLLNEVSKDSDKEESFSKSKNSEQEKISQEIQEMEDMLNLIEQESVLNQN